MGKLHELQKDKPPIGLAVNMLTKWCINCIQIYVTTLFNCSILKGEPLSVTLLFFLKINLISLRNQKSKQPQKRKNTQSSSSLTPIANLGLNNSTMPSAI